MWYYANYRKITFKIKVNFLLVGHTHDPIDQMFSRFSKKLARCDGFTLPTLSRMITEAYTPKPDVQHLDKVYDFKGFCVDGDGTSGRVLAPLNNISFNHVFFIKKYTEHVYSHTWPCRHTSVWLLLDQDRSSKTNHNQDNQREDPRYGFKRNTETNKEHVS